MKKGSQPCVSLSGGGRDWLTQKFSALELALISRRGERNVQLAAIIVPHCSEWNSTPQIRYTTKRCSVRTRATYTRCVFLHQKLTNASGSSHYNTIHCNFAIICCRLGALRFAASSERRSDVTAAIFALFARALRFLRQPRNYFGWAHCSPARYREARKLTPLTRQQSWKLRVSVTEPEGSGRFLDVY